MINARFYNMATIHQLNFYLPMKNILVATDFSPIADNALEYVIEMYKSEKLKIDLLNVAPIQYVDEATLMSMEVIIESSKTQLKDTAQKIKRQYPTLSLTVDTLSRVGAAKQTILAIIKEGYYDLLVMGMKGMSAMEKVLIGSTTASVVKTALCNMLVVPENARFNGLKRIIFATDYKAVESKKVFNPLLELAKKYEAEVDIINVNKHSLVPTFDESYEGLLLDDTFKDIKHSFHHSEEESVEAGLTHFIEKVHGDMLVMVPRKHDFFELLLNPSHTKKMVYNTHVPLLILHEEI